MKWMTESNTESRIICPALCVRFNCSGRAWCTANSCNKYNGNCLIHW